MSMSLDEAIRHCYEVAESRCNECGKEHLQLAKWLEELKDCKKLRAENAELRGQKTTTYEPLISDSRGYANQFKCDYCGCTVDTPYYMRPEQFDYIYCPYCGRYITGNEE